MKPGAPSIARVHKPQIAVEPELARGLVRITLRGDFKEVWVSVDSATAFAVARAIVDSAVKFGATAPDWYRP